MPDFDQFERVLRASMVSSASGIADFAIQLSDIEDSNRPRIFKNKSLYELERWLRAAHEKLRSTFGEEVEFSTTDVNLRGADLYIEDADQWIELKTGSVTDANAGISTIAWAIGDDDDSELSQIMRHSMVERRAMAEAGDLNGIRSSQDNTMDKLEIYFRERLTENELAPTFLCHYSRCVARCVTKKEESMSLMNITEAEWKTPRVFHANWKDGWNEVSRHLILTKISLSLKLFVSPHLLVKEVRKFLGRSFESKEFPQIEPHYTIPTSRILMRPQMATT